MPTNYNSAGSNLSPGRNRVRHQNLREVLLAVEQRQYERREEDFQRRTKLAHIRYALGERDPKAIENYGVVSTDELLDFYEPILGYRSSEMTIAWVEKYLGKMSYAELNNWIDERGAIVRHLETASRFVEYPYNPYSLVDQHLRITKNEFLFDPVCVITESEHTGNWRFDIEKVFWRFPKLFDRCSYRVQMELFPILQRELHGPVLPIPKSTYVGDPDIRKEAEEIQEQVTTAVLRQHDKMFGTNLIPKKTVCERIAAFFQTLFTSEKP